MLDRDHFDWKRFWYRQGTSFQLTDGGYLADPDGRWGGYLNAAAVAFDQLKQIPCLVLLGEPGIGKTRALAEARRQNEHEAADSGDAVQWFDLHAYQSDTRLESTILGDETVRNWLAGSHQLHLYLDGLDEALLRIETVTDLLSQVLEGLPRERMLLRIACRGDDWPKGFENRLKRLWRTDELPIYTLAPLRRRDVSAAARARGLEEAAFLAEVERAGVVPFAIKPITLMLLLNSYQRAGRLPSTQAELYERGCEILCEESNEHRRETRQLGMHTATERLAAASCIAAATVFSNRYAVWTALDRGEVPEADLSAHEIVRTLDDGLGVEESAIREALATGLFVAPSVGERAWAHQTYAEYLAARFVAQYMTSQQVLQILLDQSGKLVPQLRAVAAWIASLIPETFEAFAAVDPEAMLRADLASAEPANRACLVRALLATYDAEDALDRDPALRRRYAALAHPTLADQLRPYIVDSTKGVIVRRVAVEIAAACDLRSLQPELTKLALDTDQLPHLRARSADALAAVGGSAKVTTLRTLAFGQAEDDPDDDLKGTALRALWPAHLSARELFSILTPPQNDRYYGAYAAYLLGGFESRLAPEDLPAALEWAERHATLQRGDHFHGVVDRILLAAWAQLEREDVLQGFARTALKRLESHQSIVVVDADASDMRGDGSGEQNSRSFAKLLQIDERRHSVLDVMLQLIAAGDRDPFPLIYGETALIMHDDVGWLISRLRSETSESMARVQARAIRLSADLSDPNQLDAILLACADIPALAEEYRWLLEPVMLDSPEAARARPASARAATCH